MNLNQLIFRLFFVQDSVYFNLGLKQIHGLHLHHPIGLNQVVVHHRQTEF